MNVALAGCAGLFFGGMIGGIVGIVVGLVSVSVFNISSFEGYSGMLVFFTFMPVGAILGALAGAGTLGYLASRKPTV